MARMIPNHIVPTTESSAERLLFGLIQGGLSDQWTVLHSLNLSGGKDFRWGETDFVLIGPTGIYCLEAKAGRISYKDGAWYSGVHRLEKSPFQQGQGSSVNVYNYLRTEHPEMKWLAQRDRDALVGYGVLFPDVSASVRSIEVNQQVVYDQRDRSKDFEKYVDRLSSYWMNTHGRRDLETKPYTSSEITALSQALRKEFELRESIKFGADEARRKLVQLTDEQYSLIDHFDLELNPRMIVEGTAGSGKTLCAVELAKGQLAMGRKTLILCYNRKLAGYLRNHYLSDYPDIEVQTFHSLMQQICAESEIDTEAAKSGAEDGQFFEEILPGLCAKALASTPDRAGYDTIIVDEAQDLLLDNYVLIIDELLEGGLEQGRWVFFSDANQSIFAPSDGGSTAYDLLMGYGPSRHRLRYNCRNTHTTAAITQVLTGLEVGETRTDGPTEKAVWYRDANDQVRVISRLVNRLLSEGFAPGDIIILSHRSFARSDLSSGLDKVPYDLFDWTSSEGAVSPNVVRFSTIQSFKGLESDIVIIADIDSLKHPNFDRAKLNYVGATRACLMLIPAIHWDLKDQLEPQLDALHVDGV